MQSYIFLTDKSTQEKKKAAETNLHKANKALKDVSVQKQASSLQAAITPAVRTEAISCTSSGRKRYAAEIETSDDKFSVGNDQEKLLELLATKKVRLFVFNLMP